MIQISPDNIADRFMRYVQIDTQSDPTSTAHPTTEKQIIIVNQSNIREIEFTISGMTCASCGEHVNSEVNKLTGIISSDASYENKNAVVKFDGSKTNIDEIENAINGTGYVVTAKKEYQLETIGREKP